MGVGDPSGSVVVTGVGVASALGTGLDAHRAALLEGRDGIRPVARFDTSRLPTHVAAMWPGWDGRVQPEPDRERSLFDTSAEFPLHELALVAAREALERAKLAAPRRAALVFGTCFGQGFEEFNPVAERIAAGLGIEGPIFTISTACSSSTNAIGVGRDLLLQGHADVVIAGGADELLREAFAGFSALGVLSPEPCAPFSEPAGTTLGEGAGFVVLERARDADARGAPPAWATIEGYGLSSDGFHETTPDPSGDGVARAIRGALHDAGWSARDVDFVSAHATGTENNDRVEWSVLERELGAPCTSGSKGHVGHAQGASGVLELALALLCHREGAVPPTLHFRGPRAGCPADPVAQATPRARAVSRAIKLSAAFGGANAVLAYGCGREGAPPRARARRPVSVAGAGVVGAHGAFGLGALSGLAPSAGRCREVDLESLGVDPRRLDRSARMLTGAAAIALRDARLERAADVGLFVAATRMPEQSTRRCTESIRQRGIAGTSASAFARMSVNAPTGACSQALGLLGPTSTLSAGEGSGLLAIALAAEWLALREDAAGLVAGAVDEWFGDDPARAEGAACLALARRPGDVLVSRWAIGGARDALDVARRAAQGVPADLVLALAEPDVTRALTELAALGVTPGAELWGAADASRACVMAAHAVHAVRSGRARSVLTVAARGTSSVAVLFERGAP